MGGKKHNNNSFPLVIYLKTTVQQVLFEMIWMRSTWNCKGGRKHRKKKEITLQCIKCNKWLFHLDKRRRQKQLLGYNHLPIDLILNWWHFTWMFYFAGGANLPSYCRWHSSWTNNLCDNDVLFRGAWRLSSPKEACSLLVF